MFYINLCFLVINMANGEKQWIKPGFLAKQKRTQYEMERYKTIKKNKKKMDALQLKRLAASLMGSTQPNSVNHKGKNIRVEVDDDDYIPSDHEDDTDDAESFESVDDEVLYVWPFFFVIMSHRYIFVNDALLIPSLYFHILFWVNKS